MPPTRLEKLKTYSYFAVLVIGIGLALYGALSFLFSWMPHRWGSYDEEGEWTTTAMSLSLFGAFIGLFGLLSSLEKTAAKVSELQKKVSDLQLRQTMAASFDKLLQREVAAFASILAYPETAATRLAKIEQEIKEAESTRAVFLDDARICRDLVDTFRQAMNGGRR
jgi:hypothetical protein